MIRFRQFLRNEQLAEEVATTRRQGIQHLSNMKPEQFVQWMKTVRTEMSGVLKNIKAVMKIDGLGFRFGKDRSGKVFIEGSRTGPISDEGAFSAYARGKTDDIEIISRAVHYDDILKLFQTSDFMSAIPQNTKIVAELFYNPMAKENDMGITFVTVQYDKKKLGSQMTIMPYTVLQADIGRDHPQKDSILKALYAKSDDKIKIINPNLNFTEIDVSIFANEASAIPEDALTILKSRKPADKPAKQNLLNMIQKIKDDLADYLLNHPGIEGKFKLGPDIEGIVLHLPDKEGTAPYKITTPEFKSAHAAQKGQ
jgi:hypothetical protein